MTKAKLIQGSKEHADDIKCLFESWGADNVSGYTFENTCNFYYVNVFGDIEYVTESVKNQLVSKNKAEIFQLSEENLIRPFTLILGRSLKHDKNWVWHPDMFLEIQTTKNNNQSTYVCTQGCWDDIIPYHGNESLAGTSDEPMKRF